ncbi:uncharacterized protein LOC127878063 [Dreissena polymorpha]|uniref:Chitin-binding type-4 domain-containing protein n=1 Tax=Dreissena polymorpha TaxID=45954 RepID=A0A9D4MVN7_DREPO|nr:uncharacterized protein LOC127878063 [Dreissena polymorpha]KAH3882761.1 hypothetical protein DPMN_006706 [Dreissena polymorpha]
MDLMRSLLMLCTCCIGHVLSSGSLYDPPNRAVMWKYGFPTSKNYNYMQLNCGGEKQPLDGPPVCGVCGDPYNAPKEHEKGGQYGTGMIGRYYPAGIKEINVKVELLAFEKGFFEFRLCPVNNGTLTQQCLDEHLLPIKEGYMAGTPMRFYPDAAGDFRLTVAVPPDMTCDLCVIQWRYRTANSWGEDPESKKEGLGFGPQEEFYNCADIRIGGEIPSSVRANPFFSPQDVSIVKDVQDAVANTVAVGPQTVDHLRPGARAVLFDASTYTNTSVRQDADANMLVSSWSVNSDSSSGTGGTGLVVGSSTGADTTILNTMDQLGGNSHAKVDTKMQQPTIGMVLTQTQSAGSQLSGQTSKVGTEDVLLKVSQQVSDTGSQKTITDLIGGTQTGSVVDLSIGTVGTTVGDLKRTSLIIDRANVQTPTVGLVVGTSGPKRVGMVFDKTSQTQISGVAISSGTQEGTSPISESNIKHNVGEKTVSMVVNTVGLNVPNGNAVISSMQKQGDGKTVGLVVNSGAKRVGLIVDGNKKESTVSPAGGVMIDMGSSRTIDVVHSGSSSGRDGGKRVGFAAGSGFIQDTPFSKTTDINDVKSNIFKTGINTDINTRFSAMSGIGQTGTGIVITTQKDAVVDASSGTIMKQENKMLKDASPEKKTIKIGIINGEKALELREKTPEISAAEISAMVAARIAENLSKTPNVDLSREKTITETAADDMNPKEISKTTVRNSDAKHKQVLEEKTLLTDKSKTRDISVKTSVKEAPSTIRTDQSNTEFKIVETTAVNNGQAQKVYLLEKPKPKETIITSEIVIQDTKAEDTIKEHTQQAVEATININGTQEVNDKIIANTGEVISVEGIGKSHQDVATVNDGTDSKVIGSSSGSVIRESGTTQRELNANIGFIKTPGITDNNLVEVHSSENVDKASHIKQIVNDKLVKPDIAAENVAYVVKADQTVGFSISGKSVISDTDIKTTTGTKPISLTFPAAAATAATDSLARSDSVVYEPDTSRATAGAHTLAGSTVDFSTEARPRLTIERESLGSSGVNGNVPSSNGPSTAFTLDLRNIPERRVEGSRRLFNQVIATNADSQPRTRTDSRQVDQGVVNIEQQLNTFDIGRVPNGHTVEAGVQMTAEGTMTTGFGPRIEVARTRGRRLPDDSFTVAGPGGDLPLPEGLIPGDQYRIVTDPRTGRQERIPIRSDVGIRLREAGSERMFGTGSDAFVDFGVRDGGRVATTGFQRIGEAGVGTTGFRRSGDSGVDTSSFRRSGESGVDTSGLRRSGDSRVDTSGFSRSGDSGVETASFRRSGESGVDTSGLRRSGDSEVDTSGFRRIGDSGVDRAGFRSSGESGVDTTIFRRSGDSGVDTAGFRRSGESGVDTSSFRRNQESGGDTTSFRRIDVAGRDTGQTRTESVRGGTMDARSIDGGARNSVGSGGASIAGSGSRESVSSSFIRTTHGGDASTSGGGSGGGRFDVTRDIRMSSDGSFSGDTRRSERGRGEFDSRPGALPGTPLFGGGGFVRGPSEGFMPMPPSMMPPFGMPGVSPGMPPMGLHPSMGPGMPPMGGPVPFGGPIGMPPSMFGGGPGGMGFPFRR